MSAFHRARSRDRRAVSLVEMIVASAVVALIVGSMGMMAVGVRKTQDVSRDTGLRVQHARIVVERVETNVRGAFANLGFPGFMVFSTQVSGATYPDVLVVWKPKSVPDDADRMPIWNELIVYACDPSDPTRLYEITLPSDGGGAPGPVGANLATWNAKIQAAREGKNSVRTLLTDQLRAAKATDGTARGAVRFDAMLRPSAAEWDAFIAGTVAWESLPWAQSLFSSRAGLRQNACDLELHLGPSSGSIDGALPFVGSAALFFQVERP